MGYWMVLCIKATLKEYKYYDGEWVLNSEDDTLKEEEAMINFVNSRSSTFTFENLIKRFPNLFPILTLLLQRLGLQ